MQIDFRSRVSIVDRMCGLSNHSAHTLRAVHKSLSGLKPLLCSSRSNERQGKESENDDGEEGIDTRREPRYKVGVCALLYADEISHDAARTFT